MREFEERREIENIYEDAKKRIKEQIAQKGVVMKGSAKGMALSEIISVLDKELEIDIAQELLTAKKKLREYCKKYSEVESLERKYRENEEKLKAQQAVADLVSMLTDETLKNAIIAYNAISENRGRGDAKEIAIAYINAKGRGDLADALEMEENK